MGAFFWCRSLLLASDQGRATIYIEQDDKIELGHSYGLRTSFSIKVGKKERTLTALPGFLFPSEWDAW
jgi:hypothetical protein